MIGTSDGETYEDKIDYFMGTSVPRKENNAPTGSVEAPSPILRADLDKRTPPPLPIIPSPPIVPTDKEQGGGGFVPGSGARIGSAPTDDRYTPSTKENPMGG